MNLWADDAFDGIGIVLGFQGDLVRHMPMSPHSEVASAHGRLVGLPRRRELRTEGRAVVPGLTDNHFHALGGGLGVVLARARTIADMLGKIAACAAETEPGGLVVTNSNWHEGQPAEQRLPLRDDLYKAAPESHCRGSLSFLPPVGALEVHPLRPLTE